MWKVIFFIAIACSSGTFSGQASTTSDISQYEYVKVGRNEGIMLKVYFSWLGNLRAMTIISNFETELARVGDFSSFYRLYEITSPIPKSLYVYLIPKNLISDKNGELHNFLLFYDWNVLEIRFNLKERRLTKPEKVVLFPAE